MTDQILRILFLTLRQILHSTAVIPKRLPIALRNLNVLQCLSARSVAQVSPKDNTVLFRFT